MHNEMTTRQRYLDSLLFGKPDRIPLNPGNGRESTRNRWYGEGLPKDTKNIAEYAYRQVGGRHPWPQSGPGFRFNDRMIPQFEEKVIDRKEGSLIVQDWKGNICEISDQFGVEYLRSAIDFVTRRWVKCPVENRQDWEDMKRRYNADDPARFPANPAELGRSLAGRTYNIGISFPGPFWQVREWTGFEGLCMMIYDDPTLVVDMIKFWEEYIARLLEKCFQYCVVDEVHLSEDMAYKGYSMISPKQVRELILPTYKRWGEIIRKAGVPIYACDSDGFIGELIPIWIEAGINVCDPIEVAAGNDIVAFRKQFGKNMAYRGGVDKRAMARGGAVIEAEMKRIEPVIRDGGFIPSCDHGVPSDVSWPDYLHYTKLLAAATGWL